MRNALQRIRYQAFQRQNGRCYYCRYPIWEDSPINFLHRYGLSTRQASQLRSTAEHLFPRSIGGASTCANIVAACAFCNRTRHRCKRPLKSGAYRRRVQQRAQDGSWHSFRVPRSADESA
jgi:hypothetical protein